jgi:hypothetical protein
LAIRGTLTVNTTHTAVTNEKFHVIYADICIVKRSNDFIYVINSDKLYEPKVELLIDEVRARIMKELH